MIRGVAKQSVERDCTLWGTSSIIFGDLIRGDERPSDSFEYHGPQLIGSRYYYFSIWVPISLPQAHREIDQGMDQGCPLTSRLTPQAWPDQRNGPRRPGVAVCTDNTYGASKLIRPCTFVATRRRSEVGLVS